MGESIRWPDMSEKYHVKYVHHAQIRIAPQLLANRGPKSPYSG